MDRMPDVLCHHCKCFTWWRRKMFEMNLANCLDWSFSACWPVRAVSRLYVNTWLSILFDIYFGFNLGTLTKFETLLNANNVTRIQVLQCMSACAPFPGFICRNFAPAQFTTLQLQCQDIVNISQILQISSYHDEWEYLILMHNHLDVCISLRKIIVFNFISYSTLGLHLRSRIL